MKRKLFLTTALVALLALAGCGPKENPDKPDPKPDPTEITSNNEAPAGFTDSGNVSWDE